MVQKQKQKHNQKQNKKPIKIPTDVSPEALANRFYGGGKSVTRRKKR